MDDVTCPWIGDLCRWRIVLEPGDDAVAMLAALPPNEPVGALPEVVTRVVVDAERSTLWPVRVTVEMRSEDRSLDLVAVLRTSRWDDPSIVIEVPGCGS